jgi:membrane protease YdiL (CAAX protease family)
LNRLLPRALAGMAAAVPLWAWVFRGKQGNFWTRMTLGAGSLGLYALRSRPELREQLPRARDLLPGILSALGLYAIFQVGDPVARLVMPAGEEDIVAVYGLRALAPKPLITLLLVTVIGPSEELFWRGLVQEALIQRFGPAKGTAAGAAAYGATHLVTGNLTLTGAAAVAGGYWGAEYTWRRRLGPLLVSHVAWDLWIFLVQPTPTGKRV